MGQQGCWVQITRVPIRQHVWQQILQVVTQSDAASAGLVPETSAATVSPSPSARQVSFLRMMFSFALRAVQQAGTVQCRAPLMMQQE
jgi:hypothetical protein